MKKSFVYLGLVAEAGGGFFIKIGKTNHPEKRSKSYQTHCPGGLDSMHAAEVASEKVVFSVESRLLTLIGSLPSARYIGGEWVKISGAELDNVFGLFIELAGEPKPITLERGRRVTNWAS